jgi:hypothetical protein
VASSSSSSKPPLVESRSKMLEDATEVTMMPRGEMDYDAVCSSPEEEKIEAEKIVFTARPTQTPAFTVIVEAPTDS